MTPTEFVGRPFKGRRDGGPERPALRLVASAAVLSLFVAQTSPALAYVKFGVRVGGRQVTLKWTQTPVRYFIRDQGIAGVTTADLQAAAGRAFASWQSVPTAGITYTFGGVTNARPGDDDGLSTLGFQERPELDRVL